jgi:undecaprenyl-diphosphatase
MTFARVYVGAHYPGDVAAGLALGATVTLIGWALLHRTATALVGRLTRTPLRALVTDRRYDEGHGRASGIRHEPTTR